MELKVSGSQTVLQIFMNDSSHQTWSLALLAVANGNCNACTPGGPQFGNPWSIWYC